MQKYLVRSSSSAGSANQSAGKQQRLEELKKVVKLDTSYIAPESEHLLSIRATLEHSSCSSEQLIEGLRRLSCYELSLEMLIESQVGPAVRRLRLHNDVEVSNYAKALIERWRQTVDRAARKRCKSKKLKGHDPQQPGSTGSASY